MIHSHLGVYGLILNSTKTKILLIKKARGPYTSLFDLPGGSMKDLELLEETLTREISEETSCQVVKATQLKTLSTLFNYQQDNVSCTLKHIAVIYDVEIIADITGSINSKGDGEDSLGCSWHDIKSLEAEKLSPIVKLALDLID